ncbi:hypothetical protein RUM44_011053 [Polyplax serrata]|uniref:Uncharacterized protein n=1 Tax=Polyplax serrata TaxID=468196 RepID=A0ABR1ANY2_POLSC
MEFATKGSGEPPISEWVAIRVHLLKTTQHLGGGDEMSLLSLFLTHEEGLDNLRRQKIGLAKEELGNSD